MTTIYMVRHAEADNSVKDDMTRPLTEKGMRDSGLVTEHLMDKGISAVYSSPYQRAVDTVAGFAASAGLKIATDERFRERAVGSWTEDFAAFSERQWSDLSFKVEGGESLSEVRDRMLEGLDSLSSRHGGESVAVATHGTALCTVLSAFVDGFGYDEVREISPKTPWIVKLVLDGDRCAELEYIDLI